MISIALSIVSFSILKYAFLKLFGDHKVPWVRSWARARNREDGPNRFEWLHKKINSTGLHGLHSCLNAAELPAIKSLFKRMGLTSNSTDS